MNYNYFIQANALNREIAPCRISAITTFIYKSIEKKLISFANSYANIVLILQFNCINTLHRQLNTNVINYVQNSTV